MASSDSRRYQHTFWQNEDIVFVIFSHIDGPEDQENLHAYQRVMSRMALTCRSFAKPAQQKLWETMDEMMPLFKLLPTFALVEGKYVLREPIMTEQWADLDRRARRVRCFYVTWPPTENIDTNVYSSVARLHKGPIFPALHSLYYYLDLNRECPGTVTNLQNPFYTPSLELLSWDFYNYPAPEDSSSFDILITDTHHNLRNDGGNLKQVILSGFQLASTTLTSVLQFSQLQVLDLDCFPGEHVTTAIFADIACLPNLLNFAVNFDESLITTLASPIGFSQLKVLKVTGPGALIHQILKEMKSTVLEKLECCFRDVNDFPETLRFILRWPKTLRALSLFLRVADGVAEPDFPLFVGVAKSLTKLVYPWEVDDARVRQIALVWPDLEELDVRGCMHGQPTKLATLTSLETLAELCPRLLTLHISVVPQRVRPRLPSDPHFIHPLKKLSFGYDSGPIISDGALSLIRHTLRLFPMLDKIAFEYSDDASYWTRGVEMTHVLHMFQEEQRKTIANLVGRLKFLD